MRTKCFLAIMLTLSAGIVHGAEPLAGNWKTQDGETTAIVQCGPDYCITAKTGKYAGQLLGSVKMIGSDYTGKLTDPRNGNVYSGKLAVDGDRLKLRGCVTSVLCKTQTWIRQK